MGGREGYRFRYVEGIVSVAISPDVAFRSLMRGFGETDFDDRIIRHGSGAGGREGRKLQQLLRREGDDLHVLPEQHHGIHGNGYRPASEAEKPAEVDYDRDLTVSVAHAPNTPAED